LYDKYLVTPQRINILFHIEEITKKENSICTQTWKQEQIKTKPMPKSFEVFNADRAKNREVTQFCYMPSLFAQKTIVVMFFQHVQ